MNKIDVCKTCKKHDFDVNKGIVCSLTGDKPVFDTECPTYDSKEQTIAEKYLKPETSTLPIKSNEVRAKRLILLMCTIMVMHVISFISDYMQYNLLTSIYNGNLIDIDEANANDLRVQIISVFTLFFQVITIVVFIQWFRRAYYNLHQKVKSLSFDESWAAKCWFVPIINLARPFQIMKELFIRTDEFVRENNNSTEKPMSINILYVWWTLWIISNVIGQISLRLSLNAETATDYMTSTSIDMINSIFVILSGLAMLRIIYIYSSLEKKMNFIIE